MRHGAGDVFSSRTSLLYGVIAITLLCDGGGVFTCCLKYVSGFSGWCGELVDKISSDLIKKKKKV